MNVATTRVPFAFHTPKSHDPIPYAGSSAADHLIQASLDRHVVSIRLVDRLAHGGRTVRVAAPLIGRDDGESFVALLAGGHPERDPDHGAVRAAIAAAGLVARAVAPEEVAIEPLATTARVIWRQRHVGVDPGMRLGLLAAFATEASMTVHELCSRVPGPRDPVFAVMALACEARLHLDLSEGFDLSTTVWGPR